MHLSIGILQGCLLMTVVVTSKAYHYADSYSVTDDIDEDDDESSEERPQKEDYTKYFSGSGNVASQHTAQPAATSETASGFVQPIDFAHLFTGANFGLPEPVGGIIAPPSASNIFTIQAAPILPGLIPGLIPRIATSATNNNNSHSSQIGFINPNPSVELRALFNTAIAPTGPAYQQQPFISQYAHPAAIISQPVSSYSMFLPNFEKTKSSVTKEVDQSQKQASQASSNKQKKMQPSKTESEEIYEANEGENDEDEENDEDDEEYVYEESENRTPPKKMSPTEAHTIKSSNSKKPRNNKKSTFKYPYPYNLSKMSPKQSSSNQKKYVKQSQLRKTQSPDNDYIYSSLFDYPETGIDESISNSGNGRARQPNNRHTNPRILASLNNKPVLSPRNVHPSFPLNERNLQSFPLEESQSIKSIYPYDRKTVGPVTLHHGFIPSASIPYAENYPQPSTLPYSSISTVNPIPSPIQQVDPLIKAHSSDIARNTKRCTKIEKQSDSEGRSAGQTMTCYKCHDVATGANYEQCSYDSQSKAKPYFESDFESLKATKKITQPPSRIRRDISHLPYDISFSHDMNVGQSVTLVRKVRQYTEYDDSSETYQTPYSTEEQDNYRFGPEYFVDGKSSEEGDSTQEVAESNSGEKCKKVRKKGITCMVCEKPTGGFYEQCSYASDPKENSYSYGTSKVYGRGSKPKGNRNRRFTNLFDVIKDTVNSKPHYKRNVRQNRNKNKNYNNVKGARKFDEYDDDEEPPEDFLESVARINVSDKKGKLVGLDPYFYGSPDDTTHQEESDSNEKNDNTSDDYDEEKSSTNKKTRSYDDYFAHLFPELKKDGTERKEKKIRPKEVDEYENSEEYIEDDTGIGETRKFKNKIASDFGDVSTIPDYFDDAEQGKDIEVVLGEFKQKDRSSCKKVMRDKMTCYLCLDEKGLQHEECMFVAASEPKNKQLAYHEVKQFRIIPTKESSPLNAIESKMTNRKPSINGKKYVRNWPRPVTAASDISELSNPITVSDDNDSHAAENIDTMKLQSKMNDQFPMSTVTIQNQKYFSKKVSPGETLEPSSSNTIRFPSDEYMASESRWDYKKSTPNTEQQNSVTNENIANKKRKHNEPVNKTYEAIPAEPPTFEEREGPEGAFSEDTEPAFDTVLQISLPKYMLEKSEHEKVFDEVLASG